MGVTARGHHYVAMVKGPLSGENVVCLTPVAMALLESVGVLKMNAVNSIVRIPIQD